MSDRDRSPVTIRDIAALAGVSPMTVSRAINVPHRVSGEARARIEAAIVETGYRPDPAARQLAQGSLGATVGEARVVLAYAEAEEARIGVYLAACMTSARQAGMQLVPLALGARTDRDAMRLERLDPQALILLRGAGASLVHDKALPACAIAAQPEGVAAVCADEAAAAYDLTQRLIFLGHRRIGFAGRLAASPADRARYEGYARALGNFGIALAPELVIDAAQSAAGAATALVVRIEPPSAILACQEDIAGACVAAVNMRGRSIPGDLAICYFDDYAIGDAAWPVLARAALPVAEMCRAAFRLLTERIACARIDRPAPPIRRVLFPRAISGNIARVRRPAALAPLRHATL